MAVKDGTTVRVHYTGTLDDGTEFDSSRGREPLEFTLGQGMLIPGFEEAVSNMNPGETVTVTIPAEDAYGEYSEEMLMTVAADQVPAHVTPEVGLHLQLSDGGNELDVTITEVTDEHITLDANHPLAGENLTFTIELLEAL